MNKYEKLFSKQVYSKNENFWEIVQKGKTEHINNELSLLPIHEELSKLELNIAQKDFDATSLYPSAMWDNDSVYPKIESCKAFKPHMIDMFFIKFNDKLLNQYNDDSAILKMK